MCENTPLEDWYDSYLTYLEGNTVWVPSYAGCKQEWCDGPFSTSTRWETIHILLCCDPPTSQDFHNLKRLQLPSRDFLEKPKKDVFLLPPANEVHTLYIYYVYYIYHIYIYMYGLSVCKVANFHIGIFHVQYPKMILEQGQPFVTCAPCQPTLWPWAERCRHPNKVPCLGVTKLQVGSLGREPRGHQQRGIYIYYDLMSYMYIWQYVGLCSIHIYIYVVYFFLIFLGGPIATD